MNTHPNVAVRNTPNSNRTGKRLISLLALPMLVAGCAKEGPNASPLDILGPLVNAPIAAPFSALGVRPNDGETTLPELHDNPRALEGLDLPSQVLAQRNLAYALEQGRLHVSVYWENPANQGAGAAGAATVMQESTHEDGRRCREMLIETELKGEQSDKRLLTYCRSEAGWLIAD